MNDNNNTTYQRALVLAGAGAAGNAWQLGLIAGLAEAGVDLTAADLVVGTSSGSTTAAQITSGVSPAELYAAILDAPTPPQRGGQAPGGQAPSRSHAQSYMDWSQEIIDTSADAAEMRRRIGAAAIERDSSDGTGQHWRGIVASRLSNHRWSRRRVLITAIDADTGEPVVFARDSGVSLVDAIAASTSSMVPHPVAGIRYLDGGYRRSANADLAAGYGRVLVLEPFSGRTRQPLGWGMDLAAQVAELHAGGSVVETVFPDAAAGDVFNANALDPSTRIPAARGGYEQGKALATRLSVFWN